MISPWPEADFSFPVEQFDDYIRWTIDMDADELVIKSYRPCKIHVHGVPYVATKSTIDSGRMTEILKHLGSASVEPEVMGGEARDFGFVVRAADGETNIRYRVNVSAGEIDSRRGFEVSMRRIPNKVPTFQELSIEPEIQEAWISPQGTTITNGIPGSGKTWLMAAGTRHMLINRPGKYQAYESPIEITFDEFEQGGTTYTPSEIGRDFKSFADGIRSTLRRAPTAANIGEARDYETINELINAGDQGFPIFTTTHATKCATVIRRLLGVFGDLNARRERGMMLLDQVNMLITQRLVEPTEPGWRVALREWIQFDDDFKKKLFRTDMDNWSMAIEEEVQRRGNSIEQQAKRAFEEGRITERAFLVHGGRDGVA